MQTTLRPHHKLVVIIGPPFVGKRNVFMEEFSSYTLIDQTVSHSLNPSMLVPKSCLIVQSFEQLSTLMHQLQVKSTECEIEYVFVKPRFGITQCLWASEFAYAEQMNNEDYNEAIGEKVAAYIDLIKRAQSLEHQTNIKFSTRERGLYVNRDKVVFSHEGLIIDAHAIFEFDPTKRELNVHDYKSVSYMLSQWNSMPSHKHARSILYYNDAQFRKKHGIPTTIDASRVRELMIDALAELDLSFPVYMLFNNDTQEGNVFNEPPNPGIFALAQYAHSLDMNKTIYLQSYVDGVPNLNRLIPVKHGIFEKVILAFSRNGQATESQQDETRVGTKIATEIEELLSPPHPTIAKMLNSIHHNSNLKSLRIEQVKRFPLLYQLGYDDNITDEFYFTKFGKSCRGRAHSIVLHRKYIPLFEDQEDDFQRDYDAQGVDGIILNPMEASTPKKAYLPTEQTAFISPLAKPKPTDENPKPAEASPQIVSPPSSTSSEEHKIAMTVDQVCQYFGITYFQRGRDYKNSGRISKMRTKTVSSSAFKLYSLCQGSREEPYKQESLFKSGRLLKSICTCPMGEEGGNCKHVCAQLLAYMDKENYESMLSSGKRSVSKIPEPQLFSTLNPMDENWCIKGKVLKKTNIKKWVNSSNSGTVAAILLKDELLLTSNKDSISQVKIVLFTEAIDAFYEKFEEGNVYLIARGNLEHRNPNYKSTEMTPGAVGQISDFEIQLNAQFSIVERVEPTVLAQKSSKPTTAESDQNEQFQHNFEKRVTGGENGNGALEFVPFVADETSTIQQASNSRKRKAAVVFNDDDDDPLMLLDEMRSSDDLQVEKIDGEKAAHASSPKSSPKKRQKIDSSTSKSRRKSEPVRKLNFPEENEVNDDDDFRTYFNAYDDPPKVIPKPIVSKTKTPINPAFFDIEEIIIDSDSDDDVVMPPPPVVTPVRPISVPANTPPHQGTSTPSSCGSNNSDEFRTPKRVSLTAIVNQMKSRNST